MKSGLSNINEVLENINKMHINDQTYIFKILSKRLIEIRRLEIAKRDVESEQAYKEGKSKKGFFEYLWKDLND